MTSKTIGRPGSLTDLVELHVLEAIRKNRLQVGDALPPELVLSKQLGVSRTIVREALGRLRMLGLLESRKKRGMVVSEPNFLDGLRRVMDPAFLRSQTQHDLFEMRLVLELGLADLLFLRKTPQMLDELEEVVRRERRARSNAQRLALEIEFHSCLYKMAGNPILGQFQSLLQPFFRQVVRQESNTGRRRGGVDHADLVAILRGGSVEDFRRAMREHLSPHFDSIKP